MEQDLPSFTILMWLLADTLNQSSFILMASCLVQHPREAIMILVYYTPSIPTAPTTACSIIFSLPHQAPHLPLWVISVLPAMEEYLAPMHISETMVPIVIGCLK